MSGPEGASVLCILTSKDTDEHRGRFASSSFLVQPSSTPSAGLFHKSLVPTELMLTGLVITLQAEALKSAQRAEA